MATKTIAEFEYPSAQNPNYEKQLSMPELRRRQAVLDRTSSQNGEMPSDEISGDVCCVCE